MSCAHWPNGSCLTSGDVCAACEGRLPVWIPCSERMPEPGAEVLVARRSTPEFALSLYISTYHPGRGYYVWQSAEIDFEAEEVSHWMPLPAPPA